MSEGFNNWISEFINTDFVSDQNTNELDSLTAPSRTESKLRVASPADQLHTMDPNSLPDTSLEWNPLSGALHEFDGIDPRLTDPSSLMLPSGSSPNVIGDEISYGLPDPQWVPMEQNTASAGLDSQLLFSTMGTQQGYEYLDPEIAQQQVSQPYFQEPTEVGADLSAVDKWLEDQQLLGLNANLVIDPAIIDAINSGASQLDSIPGVTKIKRHPHTDEVLEVYQDQYDDYGNLLRQRPNRQRQAADLAALAPRPKGPASGHFWGDDPLYFTDDEDEETSPRARRDRNREKGYCCVNKSVRKRDKCVDSAASDTENESEEGYKKAGKGSLRPLHDPNHPHVRQSREVKHKNSRAKQIQEYRAYDHYNPLPEPPAAWDCFRYTRDGELEGNRRYTLEEIGRYLFNHPLHGQGPKRNIKRSGLQLRIQRVPADTERRFPGAVSSICRFKDCQRKPDNEVRIGHYRVAFDEQSHKRTGYDPMIHAGYVHLYCLEKLMDFPSLVSQFNVRIENRHLPCEIKGENRMSMDNPAVYSVAYDFVKACKRGRFTEQYPDYPRRGSDQYNFLDDHEGTLTKALTVAKIGREPLSKAKVRLQRERAAEASGNPSCNIERHLGNLAFICQHEIRLAQIKADRLEQEGKRSRTSNLSKGAKAKKRKLHKSDSNDQADGNSALDNDGESEPSRPVKRARFHRAEDLSDQEASESGAQQHLTSSGNYGMGEQQVSGRMTRLRTMSRQQENEPDPTADSVGQELIHDSIVVDTTAATSGQPRASPSTVLSHGEPSQSRNGSIDSLFSDGETTAAPDLAETASPSKRKRSDEDDADVEQPNTSRYPKRARKSLSA